MNHESNWEELIDRHLHGELTEPEQARLAEWLDSNPAARREFIEQVQWDTELAESLRARNLDSQSTAGPKSTLRRPTSVGIQRNYLLRSLLAVAAVVIVALSSGIYYQYSTAARHSSDMPQVVDRPATESAVAKVTGLSGALVWTANRGKIRRDLSIGADLPGGTVEGLAPDSWFEAQFNDGTTVTISGKSMLTLADLGQKELRLREGAFAASVTPQPIGKPLLLQTPTATLEVLGTRFRVDADPFSTALDVSEGTVRVKRMSDGKTVDVPAQHRVTAAPDREMALSPIPESIHAWKSRLELGPHATLGTWRPASNERGATLGAVPLTLEEGKTIYTSALGVSPCDRPPVTLRPGSRMRVRGELATPHILWFGLTLRHANGDFAGWFETTLPAEAFERDSTFEVELNVDDFQLSPALQHIREQMAASASGSLVESVWCHSLFDQVGLTIAEVELIPHN